MDSILLQLTAYLRGIWRYRWWMLNIAWVICLIGWFIVARLPDQYEAYARVYVNTDSVLRPLLKGLAAQSQNQQRKVRLMTRTLLSRPNLEKVMRMTDLDLHAKDDAEKEEIIDDLAENIELKGTSRENLYSITYHDEDPKLAKLVVKSLLTIFMESSLGEERKEEDSARQFLEQQIEEYERRLAEAEDNRKLFKQRNLGFLAGETGGYYDRLRKAREQASSAELDLKITKEKLAAVQKQMEGEAPSLSVVEPEFVESTQTEYDGRIQALQQRLDDLLVQYTEKHPDVTSIRQTIEELKKKQQQARRENARLVAAKEATGSGSMFEQLKLEEANLNASIAAKGALVDEYKKRVKSLEAAVDRVLKVESEAAQLNRDYELIKKNRAELQARLESARLARKAQSRGDTVRFRVIDPPRVPPEASGPNRLLLSSIVLGIGFAVGLAVAFLMSQLRPTFDERRTLGEVTDLPVLGSVDMVWTSAQVKKRKIGNMVYTLGVVLLLLCFGAVLAVHYKDIKVFDSLLSVIEVN